MIDEHGRHLDENRRVLGCNDCQDVALLMEKINAGLAKEEAQWFVQIDNLVDGLACPNVLLRYFSGDFMAEAPILKRGGKRPRRITATGESIEEALNNLAQKAAAYLYPLPATAQQGGEHR